MKDSGVGVVVSTVSQGFWPDQSYAGRSGGVRCGRLMAGWVKKVGEVPIHVTYMVDQPLDHDALFVQYNFQIWGAFIHESPEPDKVILESGMSLLLCGKLRVFCVNHGFHFFPEVLCGVLRQKLN
jgi:hypothetical protein